MNPESMLFLRIRDNLQGVISGCCGISHWPQFCPARLHLLLALNLTILSGMQVFSSCLRSSGRTGIIASEEEDIPVAVEESYSGNYIVVFDPLDGSSNIDAAVSTGSIWGIYRPNEECLTNLCENPTVRTSPHPASPSSETRV